MSYLKQISIKNSPIAPFLDTSSVKKREILSVSPFRVAKAQNCQFVGEKPFECVFHLLRFYIL